MFGLSLCVLISVCVMCVLLIQKSDQQNVDLSDNTVNKLQYVVNGQQLQPAESTEPTEPDPELLPPEGVNDSDILNFLILCPNEEAQRTDTVMLLNMNLNTGEAALLSLPRDTYISGNYELPKLQQVYYEAKGGERGARALTEKVKEMLGFWPDYYFVLDEQTVSHMMQEGGGELIFNVSEEYSALDTGKQSISAADGMKLFCYREDYDIIETDSTKLQRSYFLALLEQYLGKADSALARAKALHPLAQTDLTVEELAYLLDFLKNVNFDEIYSTCLDGKEIKADGETFFQVDIGDAVELLNKYFNPLDGKLDIYDVNFRQKTGDSGEGNYSQVLVPTQNSTEATTPSEDESTEAPPESETAETPSESTDTSETP